MNRYIAVTQPIKYARHKNHKRVWFTIGLVWLISAAIGLPIVLGLNHTPLRDPTLCVFYNSDFVIYSSLSSFYIPCIIMVFLYYQIFKVFNLLPTPRRWRWNFLITRIPSCSRSHFNYFYSFFKLGDKGKSQESSSWKES